MTNERYVEVLMARNTTRFAQRIRHATAVGLLPLLLASGPACATLPGPYGSNVRRVPAGFQPAAQPPSSMWSRVQAVPVGTETEVLLYDDAAPVGSQIEVQLYDDEAPPDRRRVTGRFHSATANTITLYPGKRSTATLTLAQSDVLIVQILRPIKERWAGWLTLAGGILGLAAFFTGEDFEFTGGLLYGLAFAGPASLLGFISQRRQRIYEVPPEASRLITQVDVQVTDGDVLSPDQAVAVAVSHAVQAGRAFRENVGLTVCLSSQPARCDGLSGRTEARVPKLANPVTARLRIGDHFPPGIEQPLYVHVVLMEGASWRPADDPRVPQMGEAGVLDVETVTRRVTVAGNRGPASGAGTPGV